MRVQPHPAMAVTDSLADLYARGVLRRHTAADAGVMPLPGEVGSGYKSGANLDHLEPSEIFVLGTSHVSDRSADDVERAVSALRPDAIVIELCRSRSGLLYNEEAPAGDKASNAFGLSGDGGPLTVLRRSLALGGWAPLLLRVVLVKLASTLGGVEGVTPGADLRAAKRAAEAVNATIVLGDRPIEITLERAWRAMSWAERGEMCKLAWYAFNGDSRSDVSREDTRQMLDGALGVGLRDGGDAHGSDELSSDGLMAAVASERLDYMESVLAGTFPSLLPPLLTERDVFLSVTMKSSLAVSGKRRVLGVVGRAHLDGVCRALGEEHPGAFKRLTWTPSRVAAKQKILGMPRSLATRLAVDFALGVAAWSWLNAHGS
jgi:pheromone shutdown protein TraB